MKHLGIFVTFLALGPPWVEIDMKTSLIFVFTLQFKKEKSCLFIFCVKRDKIDSFS